MKKTSKRTQLAAVDLRTTELAVDGRRDSAQRPGRGAGRHGTDPSTSLGSAQDDGGEGSLRGGELGGLAANERLFDPKHRAGGGRQARLRATARPGGRAGMELILRLRCAPLRMTGARGL